MDEFAKFVELVKEVPSAFWGVVFGSLISIVAVVLTNRASSQRLKDQFAHERAMRTRDRNLALRKDIYLDAAEAVSVGIMAIGKISNLDISEDDVSKEYRSMAPAISKISIIASEDVIKTTTAFSCELSAVFLKLMAKRLPLKIKKEKMSALDDQIARSGKVRDQMLQLMTAHNIDGVVDKQKFDTICGNFEFQQKCISDALEERSNVFSEMFSDQLLLTKECVEEMARMTELLVPSIVELRKELDLPIDGIAYAGAIQESNEKNLAEVTAFLDRARTLVAPPANDGAGSNANPPS